MRASHRVRVDHGAPHAVIARRHQHVVPVCDELTHSIYRFSFRGWQLRLYLCPPSSHAFLDLDHRVDAHELREVGDDLLGASAEYRDVLVVETVALGGHDFPVECGGCYRGGADGCARVRLGVRGDDVALLEERFDDAGAGAPSLLRASGDRPHHAGARAVDSEANYVNAFSLANPGR